MVIFLDFDGVIAHRDCAKNRYLAPEENALCFGNVIRQASYWYDLDPKCINVLDNLIDTTDANVVISSAWRQWHSQESLVRHMMKFGFEHCGHVIGMTPIKLSWAWRDTEIVMWMENHDYNGDYIVLDDEEYHLQRIPKENFVYIKHGWERRGLCGARAKLELTRVLRKRGKTCANSFHL
jgi:hypothetical protein